MEQEKIKLIWDFRGADSHEIAKHHAIHLREFCESHNVEQFGIGEDKLSDMYSVAYLVIHKDRMIEIRDALKPHRGELM